MAAVNRISFAEINKALDRGDLITTDFQVVSRNGLKWVWIRFLSAFSKICCFKDPLKSFRINEVAKSLATFTVKNERSLDPASLQTLEQIFAKLKAKADKSSHGAEVHQLLLKDQNLVRLFPSQAPAIENYRKVEPAIANFANDLCARIAAQERDKSFSISPVSILVALGMCLHVIKPERKEAFLATIGLGGLTEMQAHEAIGAAIQGITFPDHFNRGTIELAQGLARKEGIVVADSLTRIAQQTYRADSIISNNLMEQVNKWVSAKTHGKIPTLLSDNKSDLVLLNAVYLAFQWVDKFEKPDYGWGVENFTFADATMARVSMMKQTGNYSIFRGDRFDMLEKPYHSPDGRNLSQLIFLPHDPQDLEQVETNLTDAQIRASRAAARMEYDVNLSMPKIKMESAFHLIDLLKEMGLPLDELDREVIPDPTVFIGDVIHKTFVSTDEDGSVAAAATAVMLCRCAAPDMRIPPQFHIRHNYAYFIMDGDTVLFRGRVADRNPLIVDP